MIKFLRGLNRFFLVSCGLSLVVYIYHVEAILLLGTFRELLNFIGYLELVFVFFILILINSCFIIGLRKLNMEEI
jgi:hypothetical protein